MTNIHSGYCPDLQASIRANWAQISRQKGNPGRNYKEAEVLANAVYHNTFLSTSPVIVIGLDQIRKDLYVQKNFCLITGYIPKRRSEEHVPVGAVLGEPQWSTLINDLFIMGAANAGKEVHTTHSEIPFASLWDDEKSTLTSFGREIAILKMANYSAYYSKLFDQVVYAPACGVDQSPLTYKGVAARLNQITSSDKARAFLYGIPEARARIDDSSDMKEKPD